MKEKSPVGKPAERIPVEDAAVLVEGELGEIRDRQVVIHRLDQGGAGEEQRVVGGDLGVTNPVGAVGPQAVELRAASRPRCGWRRRGCSS